MATKARLSVYLEPALLTELADYAAKRRKPLSMVAEAAIARFLSPDGPDRLEAALSRRLDRLSQQHERLERDLGISVEMLALFVRFWLSNTPPLPDIAQPAAQAKGLDRFDAFVEALARKLSAGQSTVSHLGRLEGQG